MDTRSIVESRTINFKPGFYDRAELQAWPAVKPNHSNFCLSPFLAGVLSSRRLTTEAIRHAHRKAGSPDEDT